MANITLAGTLRDPNGDLAVGDKVRFTHKSTTGETVKSASSILTIDPTGVYSVDLEYGLVLVEYKDARNAQFENLGVATVNGDNPATTIPELLNALVPVSSAELIEFQAILADCVAAKDAAEAAAATLDLINDLSQAYIFDTVALFKSSLHEFPDGKTIHLNDRDADFIKITGTVTATGRKVIASTSINQSVSLITETPHSSMLGNVFDTALMDELLTSDEVTLSAGTYDPYVFAQNNKTLNVEQGAVFKLPDNTTTIATTVPARVIEVTGSNVRFTGLVEIDGNLANNPSDAMNTSDRRGAVHIAGANVNFEDKLKIDDASWVAFSTGSEVDKAVDFYADLITINNPFSYAAALWSVDGFQINRIGIRSGLDSTDARFRTGSQVSSTFNCINGIVGSIITNDAFVNEARTNDCEFPSVICQAAKVEDSSRITIGSIQCKDEALAAFSFALLTSSSINVGSVMVSNHNGDTGKAVAFSEVVDCSVGTIQVINTKNTASDVEIRSASGLTIDNMILTSPDGTGRGFLFDYDAGFAPQEKIRIGNIISTGHVGLDVEFQSPQLVDMIIGNINPDATTNIEYLKNGNTYSEGTFIPALTATGGTVTLSGSSNELSYTKNGRAVTIGGRLSVSAVSAPSGTLTLTGLPFPVANEADNGGLAQFVVIHGGTATTWSGYIGGQTVEATSTIQFFGRDGNSSFDVSQLMQTNATLGFAFTYFTV